MAGKFDKLLGKWRESDASSLTYAQLMALSHRMPLLIKTDVTGFSNSTVDTNLLGTYIGSNRIAATAASLSKLYHIRGSGYFTTDAVMFPSFRFQCRLNSQVVFGTAVDPLPTATAGKIWDFDFLLRFTALGVGGTVVADGQLVNQQSFTGIQSRVAPYMPVTSVDTTVNQDFSFYVQLATNADPDNACYLRNLFIDELYIV